MAKRKSRERMQLARLFMVLSSISPLFILWAIQGNNLVPDAYFLPFCALMTIGPNVFLWLRLQTAVKLNERRELVIGMAEDHRDHLLVYLFAMLLPFYATEFAAWRDLAAALVALTFIVFLFWHLNLHYMNLFLALRGYHVFSLTPPADGNALSGRGSLVLITKRTLVSPGERLVAYRLSDTVYMEVDG